MLEGVETYGGRVGSVWEGWRCVGELEVCGRAGGVWEECRSVVVGVEVSVGGMEMCWKE